MFFSDTFHKRFVRGMNGFADWQIWPFYARGLRILAIN